MIHVRGYVLITPFSQRRNIQTNISNSSSFFFSRSKFLMWRAFVHAPSTTKTADFVAPIPVVRATRSTGCIRSEDANPSGQSYQGFSRRSFKEEAHTTG